MINYNEYDIEMYNSVLKDIEKELEINDIDLDEQVWTIARQSKKVPIFENILMRCSIDNINRKIKEKYPSLEIRGYLNSHDSSISLNGELIYDVKDFRAIMSYEKEQLDNNINSSLKI